MSGIQKRKIENRIRPARAGLGGNALRVIACRLAGERGAEKVL